MPLSILTPTKAKKCVDWRRAEFLRVDLLSPRPFSRKEYTEADLEAIDLGRIALGRSSTTPEHCNELGESAGGHLRLGKLQVNFRIVGCFAQSVTENEIIDQGQQRELLFTGHPGFGESHQALLHMAHGIQ